MTRKQGKPSVPSGDRTAVTYRVRKFAPEKRAEWRRKWLEEIASNGWELQSIRLSKFHKTGNHYVTI